MIYNSAGHHNLDSGATAMYKGKLIKENENTIIIRNKVSARLKERGYSFIVDKDTETLSAYLNRIKPGNGSVGCEHHLNASTNAKATGDANIQKQSLMAVAEGNAAQKRMALEAEADGTLKLAEALKQLTNDAKLIMILDRLPQLIEKSGDAGSIVCERNAPTM